MIKFKGLTARGKAVYGDYTPERFFYSKIPNKAITTYPTRDQNSRLFYVKEVAMLMGIDADGKEIYSDDKVLLDDSIVTVKNLWEGFRDKLKRCRVIHDENIQADVDSLRRLKPEDNRDNR